MHHGKGIAGAGTGRRAPHADRLALALEAGAFALPADGAVVVLNAVPAGFHDLVPGDRLVCEQAFRPLHDQLAAAGRRVVARAEGPAALVVVNLARARAENLGAVARGLAMLPPGGTLAINGDRTDGIDSLVRQVAAIMPPAGALAKAHGRVAWLGRPERLPPEVAEWSAAAALAPNAEGFLTAPGFFSPAGADPGSRLLAATLPGRLAGRVADLGAGWGWLARAALDACPAITEIALYEADARALEAARANVGDPRASFHWADATLLGRDAGPCDAVIANPPFHQGRAAAPALGLGFVAAAARLLRPSGAFLVVANRHLPYERELGARFGHWERLSEDAGFKVFRAVQPLRARPLRRGRGA